MNPCEWNAIIAGIANSLASRMTKREIAFWGLFLSRLGDSLETIAALDELFDGDDDITLLAPGSGDG